MEQGKYVVYATGDNGDGFVQEIGAFDDPSEIEIRTGLFDKDTLITIYYDKDR